jgi:hypothetical protein
MQSNYSVISVGYTRGKRKKEEASNREKHQLSNKSYYCTACVSTFVLSGGFISYVPYQSSIKKYIYKRESHT